MTPQVGLLKQRFIILSDNPLFEPPRLLTQILPFEIEAFRPVKLGCVNAIWVSNSSLPVCLSDVLFSIRNELSDYSWE